MSGIQGPFGNPAGQVGLAGTVPPFPQPSQQAPSPLANEALYIYYPSLRPSTAPNPMQAAPLTWDNAAAFFGGFGLQPGQYTAVQLGQSGGSQGYGVQQNPGVAGMPPQLVHHFDNTKIVKQGLTDLGLVVDPHHQQMFFNGQKLHNPSAILQQLGRQLQPIPNAPANPITPQPWPSFLSPPPAPPQPPLQRPPIPPSPPGGPFTFNGHTYPNYQWSSLADPFTSLRKPQIPLPAPRGAAPLPLLHQPPGAMQQTGMARGLLAPILPPPNPPQSISLNPSKQPLSFIDVTRHPPHVVPAALRFPDLSNARPSPWLSGQPYQSPPSLAKFLPGGEEERYARHPAQEALDRDLNVLYNNEIIRNLPVGYMNPLVTHLSYREPADDQTIYGNRRGSETFFGRYSDFQHGVPPLQIRNRPNTNRHDAYYNGELVTRETPGAGALNYLALGSKYGQICQINGKTIYGVPLPTAIKPR